MGFPDGVRRLRLGSLVGNWVSRGSWEQLWGCDLWRVLFGLSRRLGTLQEQCGGLEGTSEVEDMVTDSGEPWKA